MFDVISYLFPSSSLEYIFFLVIFGSAFLIAYLVRKNANEVSWELNWQSGTTQDSVADCPVCNGSGKEGDDFLKQCPHCGGSGKIKIDNPEEDDLHPEHGSAFQLADHVMTASEKCAEVLPSTLLIVGLLGTFLGVGMAMNAAANAIALTSIQDSSSDVMTSGGLDSLVQSMNQMSSSMEEMTKDMGAQFKSSIYGIIASLLFTFWRSRWGREKERVTWVLTKCNKENQKAKQAKDEEGLKKVSEMLEKIHKSIGSSLKKTISDGYEDRNAALANLLRTTANPSVEVLDESRRLVEMSTEMFDKMDRMTDAIGENFGRAAEAVEEMGKKSTSFSKAINASVPKLTEAADKMGDGLDKLVDDLIDGMKEKQDGLFDMVKAAEEQKLKAALSVNEVVEGSIKNLAQTNAGLTEKLELLVKNLAEIRLDMARAAGRDISTLPSVGLETEKQYRPEDYVEPVIKQLTVLNRSILQMNSENERRNNEMLNALENIQVANDKNAKVGLIKRLFGWS